MFDPLPEDDPLSLENSPWFQEKVAKGIAEEKLDVTREVLVRFIQKRFPTLTEAAKTKTAQLNQLDALNTLMDQIWDAPDEQAARALLETA